jgi:hypothetical protein
MLASPTARQLCSASVDVFIKVMEASYEDLVLEPADIKIGKQRRIYYGVEYERYELEWITNVKAAAS